MQTVLDAAPTARVLETQKNQGNKTGNDKEKLEHFIINSGSQTSQERISKNDYGRHDDAEIEVPTEKDLHQSGHCIHRNTRSENGHDCKGESIESARFFIEPQFEVFRH